MANEANARVMVPIDIVAAMLKTGTTIAEPDTTQGESAWVSGTAYAVDIIKTYNGSRYICVLGLTGTITPDQDPKHWDRLGPSNRMAPFDDYSTTKAVGVASLTYVFQPGFHNGIAIYGMEGSAYSIVVKANTGGAVMLTQSGDLYEQAAGFYELLFSPLLQVKQISLDAIPISPTAEVTITITSAPGVRVALGTIKVGDWRTFIGEGTKGATQYGAELERKSYSYYKENFDGSYDLKRRPSSRNITCSVEIDPLQAMYSDAILEEILDVAVPFEATNLPHYAYLNTLGFVSGSIRADNFGETSISFKIKGNI